MLMYCTSCNIYFATTVLYDYLYLIGIFPNVLCGFNVTIPLFCQRNATLFVSNICSEQNRSDIIVEVCEVRRNSCKPDFFQKFL